MSNQFIRGSIEMVLGQPIAPTLNLEVGLKAPRGRRGASPVVECSNVCQCQQGKQCKTRKSCENCSKPVCDEHSIQSRTCIPCTQVE